MKQTMSQSVPGSMEEALRIVRDTFIFNGFRVYSVEVQGFEARGSGLLRSRQNPLLGISHVRVRGYGSRLEAEVDLGAAARLGLLITLLPVLLGLVLAVLLWTQAKAGLRSTSQLRPLIAFAPWLVLGPVLGRIFRRRALKAMENVLVSAAESSKVS